MVDPSRRLVPSTAPEDHPIHDAAEAGELAPVRASSISSQRSFATPTALAVILCTVRSSADPQTW